MIDPIESIHSDRMKSLIEYTSSSLNTEYPSSFGASIYDAEGTLLAQAYDTVMRESDSTCHGEVNTIRKAVKKVGSPENGQRRLDVVEFVWYCRCLGFHPVEGLGEIIDC